MPNILGVGIATLDIINSVSSFPKEDDEVRAINQRTCRGGNTSNTLTVLSQFNHQCYWTGVLSDDSNSAIIRQDFEHNNIKFDFAKTQTHSATPTSYITLNQANGSRTIVHYRDLSELDFAHFSSIYLDNFDWIHFEARAIEETAKMISWVKDKYPHIPVSIEIEKPRANIIELFLLGDVHLYSKNYATLNGFNDAKSFMLKQKELVAPQTDLICAWGELGAYALLSNNDFIHAPASSTSSIIDTLGAGDTFNAGIIHSRLNNENWKSALTFACRLATKKCEQEGFQNLS